MKLYTLLFSLFFYFVLISTFAISMTDTNRREVNLEAHEYIIVVLAMLYIPILYNAMM